MARSRQRTLMAIWAIGDLQGCYPELSRLLERLKFDPANDHIWLCGDLVNRGGESLAVLRLLRSLGERVVITLGNHDLSLLAVSIRDQEAQSRVNPDLRAVLFAEDRDDIINWLRRQPLLHWDRKLDFCMVHAGISPRWNLEQAERAANEVERTLRGHEYAKLLSRMFGNRPAKWSPRLQGLDRQRAIINVLTRIRYCDVNGRIDFNAKGPPGTQRPGLYPWFSVPGMTRRKGQTVCGHWSALGRFAGLGLYALDTGCVWGGQLTALRLDSEDPGFVAVAAEPGRKPPAEKKPPAHKT